MSMFQSPHDTDERTPNAIANFSHPSIIMNLSLAILYVSQFWCQHFNLCSIFQPMGGQIYTCEQDAIGVIFSLTFNLRDTITPKNLVVCSNDILYMILIVRPQKICVMASKYQNVMCAHTCIIMF